MELSQKHMPDANALAGLLGKVDKTAAKEYLKKYDPYQIPADLEFSQDHLQATRIAKPVFHEGYQNIDDVTGLPVDNEPLSLCCDLKELNFLSPGYPMYFQYLKFCIYISFTIFLCSGLFGLISNEQGNDCIELSASDNDTNNATFLNKNCVASFIMNATLANKRKDEVLIEQ